MSKFHPPATPEDVVHTDKGELRRPDDYRNQPGQGANLTPAFQQQRGDGVPTPEELAIGDGQPRGKD